MSMGLRRTNIPYADYSWNPVVGCPLPLESVGCNHCWARDLHNKRHKARLCGKKLPAMYHAPFESLQLFSERLYEPWHTKKPGVVFLGSQSDIFCGDVPFIFLDDIWATMGCCEAPDMQAFTFLSLTKRPDEMLAYAKHRQEIGCVYALPNLWSGLTIVNQAEADAKLPTFIQIPGKKFLSVEPMLESIRADLSGIDLVIIGAESGPHRRPLDLVSVESLAYQCTITPGTRVYIKQLDLGGKCETDMAKFPKPLQIRELPWRMEAQS